MSGSGGHASPVEGTHAAADAAVDRSLADAKVLDRDGYAYVVHPITDGVPRARPELLEHWCAWAEAQGIHGDATVLLAPEAMALPLAAALSLRTGIPYLVVRKRRYGLEGERAVDVETGYGEATLYLNDVRSDDRVLVVDDVLSTGNTATAIVEALKEQGCTVTGLLSFMDKTGLGPGLEARLGMPVRAMRRVHVEGGRVVPVEAPAE